VKIKIAAIKKEIASRKNICLAPIHADILPAIPVPKTPTANFVQTRYKYGKMKKLKEINEIWQHIR
jgi:hypothetical protein